MKPLLLLLLFSISVFGHLDAQEHQVASAKGVHFLNYKTVSFSEVLDKARAKNKYIFVDIWTTWCGPCKLLAAQAFPSEKLGEYMNTNFLNLTFDAEDKRWIDVTDKLGATYFPTLLILDSTGNIVHALSGIRIGENDAAGEPYAVQDLIDECDFILKLNLNDSSELVSKKTLDFILTHQPAFNSIMFTKLIHYKTALQTLNPKARLDEMISDILGSAAVNLVNSKYPPADIASTLKVKEFYKTLDLANPKNKEEIKFSADYSVASVTKNWKRMVALVDTTIKNHVLVDSYIEYVSRDFLQCPDKRCISEASRWMKALVERTTSPKKKAAFNELYVMLRQLSDTPGKSAKQKKTS